MRLPRLRAALAVAVLVPLGAVPAVVTGAGAAGPLTCAPAVTSGPWQRLAVPSFANPQGVAAGDTITSFALDASRPQDLLVSNGTVVQVSGSNGCDWRSVLALGVTPTAQVPLSGSTSAVVALAALPGGPSLAAVREGTGAASRPHVLSSPSGEPGTWSETSAGLPLQGAPRVLEAASDGRTAYLAIAPVSSTGGPTGALPGLPGPTSPPTGLLYATTDGGRSWELRTGAGALPSGGFDALAVDVADPQLLYGVSGGRLVLSRDGGRTVVLPDTGGAQVTAVEPMEAGEVAVLTTNGQLLHSRDAGTSFDGRPAPAGARGAAYRTGDGTLVVEADGALWRTDARGRDGFTRTDPGVPATEGSLRGDRAQDGSFHALGGAEVLRYVDPPPPGSVDLPPPPGDLPAPPPPLGRVEPASRSVRLPVGTSTTVDFRLLQPQSPTPLDLFLLVDASESMGEYIDDLQANLRGFTDAVQAEGVDLHVGVGLFTAGPKDGEGDYPAVDPSDPGYRRPDFFRVLRPVAPVDPGLEQVVASIRPQDRPSCCSGRDPGEGGLFGLRDMLPGQGRGLRFQSSTDLAPTFQVPPGQLAGFRSVQGVRRVVVHVADDPFRLAHGVPEADGQPDIAGVARDLVANRVSFVGVGVSRGGGAESTASLREMARLNGTFAPAGGVDCGDEVRVDEGEPLVCDSTRNLGPVIGRLATALADRQTVVLRPRSATPVLGALDATRLADLDVTVPTDVPFSVTVSCIDVAPGEYRQEVDAVLRGTVVATAAVDVACLAALPAAEVPPRPDPPLVQDPAAPAAQPAAQAPAAPAPAPPVVQPQAQPQPQAQTQVQAQVNPMTAAALQQQEELALALALSSDERAAPSSELAMVDRRRGEQLRAQALLYTAMAGCAALGLARLRGARGDDVRVRRSS